MTYSFLDDGFAEMGPLFSPEDCAKLIGEVRKRRNFDNLFLDEAAYRSNPQHVGVNPRVGRNLIEKLDSNFIFENKTFLDAMQRVLGNAWRVLDYKFVMGVPHSWLPDWLLQETKGLAVANLGAYVRPEYRDITYFHGIDFHQDIIDFKDRPADFVTGYIYLEDTTADSSPLHVVPGSHQFGATIFPHKIHEHGGKVDYTADDGRRGSFDKKILTGPTGSLYFWHACILHGTQPHGTTVPRISVRLLLEKNRRSTINCELDLVNARIKGKLSLETTRRDLDEVGAAALRGNSINKMIDA